MAKIRLFLQLFVVFGCPIMLIIILHDFKLLSILEIVFGTNYIIIAAICLFLNNSKRFALTIFIFSIILIGLGTTKLLGVY